MSTFNEIRDRMVANHRFVTTQLELTYRCNYHCLHCYCVEQPERPELSTEAFKNVIDQLYGLGCMNITFTGGEAIIRKDFFELATYARSKRFVIRLFSNGHLLDGGRLENLLELKPISVDISLYGASDRTYAAVTGDGERYSRVKRNIEKLAERGQRVIVKIPLMHESYHDLDRMIRWCREIGVPYLTDVWMTPKDDGSVKPTNHALTDDELRDFFSRYGTRAKNLVRHDDEAICTAACSSPIISPNGDVFACTQNKLPAGNVLNQPLAEIWKDSPWLREVRSVKWHRFTECHTCEFRETCFICPAISLYENGRLEGPNSHACRVARIRHELGQV